MQPDHVHVERSLTVNATPADVAPMTSDLKKVNAWSPWEGKDPNQTTSYSEKTAGVGATYDWSGNDEVGKGRMTIKSVEPGKTVIGLEFFEPFSGVADATVVYAAEGDGTKVTWMYDAKSDMMVKLMGVFMSMDEMLGPDYEKGLAMLKPIVEKHAQDRLAAEKAAAEKAAAEKAAAEKAAAAEGETADGAEGKPAELAVAQ